MVVVEVVVHEASTWDEAAVLTFCAVVADVQPLQQPAATWPR